MRRSARTGRFDQLIFFSGQLVPVEYTARASLVGSVAHIRSRARPTGPLTPLTLKRTYVSTTGEPPTTSVWERP